jgi:hypothetical protein
MVFMKDVRSETLAKHARRAAEEGRTVFAPRLGDTSGVAANTTMPVSGWAELIEAVETEGWLIQHWTVVLDHKGRPEAYPLFRRTPGDESHAVS